MEDNGEAKDRIVVRRLRPDDLQRVVALDAKIVGRPRDKFFEAVLRRNLNETGLHISLAAELRGMFVGFVLGRAWYGQLGTLEPYAVLEALAVHPDFRRLGVGSALLDQLMTNLRGLNLRSLRTELDWSESELLAFFHHREFRPGTRLVLERELTREPAPASERSAAS